MQQRAGHEKEHVMRVKPQYVGKEQLLNYHAHNT